MTNTDARLYQLVIELIPLIEAKIAAIEAQGTAPGNRRGGQVGAIEVDLTDLETFLVRLQQIKAWLEEGNPAFVTALRQFITHDNARNQRREARRDWSIAIVTTVAGAILGWFSSLAATPTTLWHLLVH